MNLTSQFQLSSWLPSINQQIWILAIGRFLSEIGTGFTMFYASIFFVNQVGLSATAVGTALGSAAISGIVGKIMGGSLADASGWGRRRTLLLSAVISSIGCLVLATTSNFATLVVGSLFSGLGIGFYWPATEAVVADNSQTENRRAAFALTRLADNIGLAIGSILAGFLVGLTHNYRWLFIIDAISYMVFFVVVYVAISENEQPKNSESQQTEYFANWLAVFRNRPFLIYIAVNITFATYISQLRSTLPLYFKNFVSVEGNSTGIAETTISVLFAWHLIVVILCQLPITNVLQRYSHTLSLTVSALLWAIGFTFIWVTSIAPSHQLIWVALALGVFAAAIVAYHPAAAALVTELSPESQRGVYFSVHALCWAFGNFLGHPLGGWALDQPRIIANNFWLGFSLSIIISVPVLQYLKRILLRQEPTDIPTIKS